MLEYMLATVQIANPRFSRFPPCIGPVKVEAPRAHSHSRHSRRMWLMGIAMEINPAKPLCKHVVAQ